MLYTINGKFYAIAMVLIFLFSLGYGILAFFLRDQHQNTIEMVIGDDGIGIPKDRDFRNTETFGLQLITGLVGYQLAGDIVINRNAGTEFRIRFKYLFCNERG